MELQTFIDSSTHCCDTEMLFQKLNDYSASLGFNHVAYSVVSDSISTRPKPTAYSVDQESFVKSSFAHHSFPQTWVSRYKDKSYETIDPVLMLSLNNDHTIIWNSLDELLSLSQDQINFLNEAKSFGLAQCATIPLHGPNWQLSLVTYSSDQESTDISEATKRDLVLASTHFYKCYRSINAQAPKSADCSSSLSKREIECLTWVTQGKSSWEISIILGISENTVNFHLKNAMRKLDASHRIVAVVKAINKAIIRF